MAFPLKTEQAKRDLLEIWVYIAENSFDAADRILDTINETCQRLAEIPGMGLRREELAPGLRSFPVGKYLIFYRQAENGIVVIRVLHGARNLENLFPMKDTEE
ncbi:MAG TPA: type II toxin-antitoxin system RelE/ParE family toxin [Chthonomonadaceae bacterium]|nr:type II toxin-antitoxin system RelE/ParE family toxin [Chthonomonadaceae bacterium]